jgi:hypothetical protein
MRAIIIVMLSVQVAMVLAAAVTIIAAKPHPGRRRPIWSSLAIALVLGAGTSWQIAERHAGAPGADLLRFGAPLLLGLGLACLFFHIRRRRGLDAGD